MSKPKEFSYEGKDLETMSLAENYHQWILNIFQPLLGDKLVEVGAGSGSFSEMLAALKPQSLSLIEPSKEMYPLLQKQTQPLKKQLQLRTYNDFLGNVAKDLKRQQKPDSLLYVNVLEHVPDDRQELKIMYDLLPVGGRIFIFVPALQGLMSDFDKKIGHFRRYTKKDLEAKAQQAGLTVIKSQYFDICGIAPWWLKFKVMKSTTMEPKMAHLYDKTVVPIARHLEGLVRPPIGKNVLLVAEKRR